MDNQKIQSLITKAEELYSERLRIANALEQCTERIVEIRRDFHKTHLDFIQSMKTYSTYDIAELIAAENMKIDVYSAQYDKLHSEFIQTLEQIYIMLYDHREELMTWGHEFSYNHSEYSFHSHIALSREALIRVLDDAWRDGAPRKFKVTYNQRSEFDFSYTLIDIEIDREQEIMNSEPNY